MKLISLLMMITLLVTSVSFSFAQTKKFNSYGVSALVSKGKDTKEVDSEMTFYEEAVILKSDKSGKIIKEFRYADIKGAEYSYSKKPMWKTALVTGLFIGVLAIPFLFIRKKSHWLTITADNDFAVIKMEYKNYKKILEDLDSRNIKLEMLEEN
jgi:hypothetical protein